MSVIQKNKVMKKLILSICFIVHTITVFSQSNLQNKIDSCKFPRLYKLNWYNPNSFRQNYYDQMGIDIGSDMNKTALIRSLRIFDMLVSSGLADTSVSNKFLYLKDSLNPNTVLFINFNTNGIDLPIISINHNGTFPYRPEWFSNIIGSTLVDTAQIGDSVITIQQNDKGKFVFYPVINDSARKWNDNIFIEDNSNSEMLYIKSRIANKLIITPNANYSNYDFSQVKHMHLPGTKVWIIHCPNWHGWWGYNISPLCPQSASDNLRFNEFHPQKILEQFNQCKSSDGTQVADGIWLDTFDDFYYGPFNTFDKVIPYADFNVDGIPDFLDNTLNFQGDTALYIQWANQQWFDGRKAYTENLRLLTGDSIPVVQNNGRGTHQFVNGLHFEDLPALVYAPDISGNHWTAALAVYDTMMNCTNCPKPRICQILAENHSLSVMNYQKMRKSLTFSLMNNGFFGYTDCDMYAGYTMWWFDEFAVDSLGNSIILANGDPVSRVDPTQMNDTIYQKLKNAKGYLGFPFGSYQNLGGTDTTNSLYGVLKREFEKGVVFCNLRPNLVNIPIFTGDSLKHIKGKQDSLVNNGQDVTGVLTLNGNDGIILLRKNNIVTNVTQLANTYAIFLFPNPFSSHTTLWINKNLSNATLTVENILGQTVAQIKNISGQTITLHRGNLPTGLYFLRLRQGDKIIATKKIIITD